MRPGAAVLVGLLVLAPLAVAEPLPPPEFPEYAEHDPYYTDEFDALKSCAERQAATYRYDYDHPEASQAEQIAAVLRRMCATEIAALSKLVSPLEKTGGPQELIGALDNLVVEPFFRTKQGVGLEPGSSSFPNPGTSVLGPDGRRTHFRAARGFGPDERVAVSRTDAFDAPNFLFAFDQRFHYYGQRDGWRYSYYGAYGSWYGAISKGDVTATLNCSRAHRGVVRWDDHCGVKVEGLISIGSRGKALKPLRLCNPGHFETGDVQFRPDPPHGAVREVARAAKLTIDGDDPIALPDGADCLQMSDALLSRVTRAKRLHSSFIGRFDTRNATATESGEVVAMGLALLERLHALTFDSRSANEMRTDQQNLYHRAPPFNVRDALSAHDAWHGSVACVARVAAPANRARDEAIAAALGDPRCADLLADLDWQAASLRSLVAIAGDGAARSTDGPRKIAEARTLVRAQVAALLAQESLPKPRQRFAEEEMPTSVMGKPGFAGHTETVRARASSSDEPYAYAIEGRRSWGILPSSFFNGYNGGLPPQSIVITCDADRSPACAIRISTDDRNGTIELRTNGTWHGAQICIAYGNQSLSGWHVSADMFSKEDGTAVLDDNGCVTERHEVIARAFIEQSTGPVLVEPGGTPSGKKELISFQEVPFALALTRFLAERVTAAR